MGLYMQPHKHNVFTRYDTEVSKHVGMNIIRGAADKSLARPGRKQATASKIGIYSTYSPRSSIHF